MTEKWTPMKALRKADKALEYLMVPPFQADLSEHTSLEFSNLMNANSRTLEEFLVLYGSYKAYLESRLADVDSAKSAVKAAFEEGYSTAIYRITEDRESEGRKKLTREEIRGAALSAYPQLRELSREIIEQDAEYTKMNGLLNAYTSAYHTVSRIVSLRTAPATSHG